MTPEGRVKKQVKAALDKLGADCWRFMPVQTGFGSPALDYLLSIRGRFVAIETKAPGKKLTPLQEGTKAAIEAAGGIVLVVWDEGSLAIAMKIILALEFAPRDNQSTLAGNYACLNASKVGPTELTPANPETKRQVEQYSRSHDSGAASDAATRRYLGASGAQPQRRS